MPASPTLTPAGQPDLDPALMQSASQAAYAEVYAMDRKRFSDADWAKFEPVLHRAFDALRRQIAVRFELVAREQNNG